MPLCAIKSRHRRRVVPQKLTAESKCEIAVLELEHVHQNLCVKTRDSEKLAGTLQAVLEETDMRTAELKKDAYEFKRDIVIGAENMRTGKAISEKVTRYMEDTLRQRDNLIEKLRLKNVSLKSQLLKVEAQLKHKEEMGDVLHYIDFHQLQIENKQYQGQIEDLNEELLRLKMMTGSSMQRLGIVKLRLSGIAVESQQIDGELLLRREHLDKVNGETKTVYAEMAVENRSCIHLHEKRAIHAPMTLDYVKQKVRSGHCPDYA